MCQDSTSIQIESSVVTKSLSVMLFQCQDEDMLTKAHHLMYAGLPDTLPQVQFILNTCLDISHSISTVTLGKPRI